MKLQGREAMDYLGTIKGKKQWDVRCLICKESLMVHGAYDGGSGGKKGFHYAEITIPKKLAKK